MTANPLEQVIEVHAREGVTRAKEHVGFRGLCVEHDGDRAFDRLVARVNEVAAYLEKVLEGQSCCDQVELALVAFNGYRSQPKRRNICRELTRRRYAPDWSPEQRSYYEDAVAKLESWRDYFLSFSNHNPTPDQVMVVNNQHKVLIEAGLSERFRPPRTRTENLLALLLEYRLRNQPLDGFYYPEDRSPGNVKAELQREARASFAFVQLLHNSMFFKWPNYCKEEFDAAAEDDSRMLIFVLAGAFDGFISSTKIDSRMLDWHARILESDVLELLPVATAAAVRDALASIQKHIVGPVEAARQRLFQQVPPSPDRQGA